MLFAMNALFFTDSYIDARTTSESDVNI